MGFSDRRFTTLNDITRPRNGFRHGHEMMSPVPRAPTYLEEIREKMQARQPARPTPSDYAIIFLQFAMCATVMWILATGHGPAMMRGLRQLFVQMWLVGAAQ